MCWILAVAGSSIVIAMAQGRVPRARSGRNYVSDKSLQVARTPHAFALFLSDMKTKAVKLTGRRLRKKTTVWRMDLLAMRYRSLPAAAKQTFVEQSRAALCEKKKARAAKLQPVPTASTQAAPWPCRAPAVAEQSSREPATSVAEQGAQLWLALPMLADTPDLVSEQPEANDTDGMEATATRCPRTWQWLEPFGGCRRELEVSLPSLGAGSYGCCLSAKDKLTGETFCVKVPRRGERESQANASLRHEYKVLKELHHPNVVRSVAWATSNDGSCEGFVMFLAESNLWQWLEQRPEIARDDGLSALLQIARGVSYVHGVGLVHLDLKPENIVITKKLFGSNVFEVADFGQCVQGHVGKKTLADRVASNAVNTAVYRPLHLFHAAGALVSAQFSFDVWALGCIVFDVMQQHPRLRNTQGRVLRLFSGINMAGEYQYVLRARNYRLAKKMPKDSVAVVVRFQPDRAVSSACDRPLRAELVLEVMQMAT